MPIIERPLPNNPLSQGDLLSGVQLSVTNRSNEASRTGHRLCLVLSRPCVTLRKAVVVVAAVEKYPDDVPKDLDSFDKVLKFLTTIRDGVLTPDLFYLGQIPNHKGRFCARFDSIHTMEVPVDEPDRSEFIQAHRLGRLQIGFVRDLHLRLLRAFASLGFDDHDWLSDPDLQWLVQQGKTDIARIEAELSEVQAELTKQRAAGKEVSVKQSEQLARKVEDLRQKIRPFVEQVDTRGRISSEPG